MRTIPLVLVALCLFVHLPLQAQPTKAKSPYQIEFDRGKDVERLTQSPDGAKKAIFVRVRFAITLDGSSIDKLDGDFKLVIKEDGKFVKEVNLPQPAPSDNLSVMLALDTSGSMKEHGRIVQARAAAEAFLKKLPARVDCGLILFDHEIRHRSDGSLLKMTPSLEREPLLKEIRAIQPRGGTAYLDATFEGITMLRSAPRGRERAVVLLTDGIDLNSKKTIDQVIALAVQDRTRVYTIGIGEPGKFEQVNTVLALDHSGSMTPPAEDADGTSKINAMHLAAERYIDSMSSLGRCSIVPFSSLVGRPGDFLDKARGHLLKRSVKKLTPFGETALFDATYEAIAVLEADGATGKRAVIAMTDGIDNSSRRRVEEVIDRAKAGRVPLYLLGFGRLNELDDATMRRMADETGGKYYHAKNKAALLEIFEQLSIQLHDDGIDEITLKKIAKETKGQYYPAKDVSQLRMILEQVTKSIQREAYEIVFESKFQTADGRQREVVLELVRRGAGGDQVLETVEGSYQVSGLIPAVMSPAIYLVLLAVVGGLLALPGWLGRSSRA